MRSIFYVKACSKFYQTFQPTCAVRSRGHAITPAFRINRSGPFSPFRNSFENASTDCEYIEITRRNTCPKCVKNLYKKFSVTKL